LEKGKLSWKRGNFFGKGETFLEKEEFASDIEGLSYEKREKAPKLTTPTAKIFSLEAYSSRKTKKTTRLKKTWS
jgi:hypothetical protein